MVSIGKFKAIVQDPNETTSGILFVILGIHI